MFAYPSGHAHVGHVRNYIIGDVMARTKRMRGFNVLHPFGWDAFGLPAENAAIKTGTHPETSTLDNIAHMKGQLQRLGISYAWEREIATCLPEYYKFNQWIFLKMFERGLAYRKRSTVNWCPSRQHRARQRAGHRRRLLALRHDRSWRAISSSGSSASPRTPTSCSKGLDTLTDVAREGRRHAAQLDRAIGRRAGQVSGRRRERRPVVEVFTTRIDTIYGATFVAARARAPAGRAVRGREPPIRRRSATSVAAFRALDREARLHRRDREGRLRHRPHARSIRSPARTVPIWIANFVLAEYGTGAIMAVPAHDERDFEFARKYDLPIRIVVAGGDDRRRSAELTEATTSDGRLVDSGEYTGQRGAGGHHADDRRRREARHRQGRGAVPPEGLGHLASALLGHADSDRLLREGRRRRRCRTSELPVELPKVTTFTGPRRFAAGAGAGVRQRDVSEVRRPGAARDRHDGHVRRFVVVLPAVLRSEERGAAVRSGDGRATGCRSTSTAAASSTRFCTCSYSRFFTRVLRDVGLVDVRRAVQAPAHAGHGAQGRRRHVEVEGQRRRSGRHAARSTAPTRCGST